MKHVRNMHASLRYFNSKIVYFGWGITLQMQMVRKKSACLTFIYLCIHSFMNSCKNPFIYSFSDSSNHSFIHSWTCSLIHSFIYPYIHSFIETFNHPRNCSFSYPLIFSVIHSINHSFIYSVLLNWRRDTENKIVSWETLVNLDRII